MRLIGKIFSGILAILAVPLFTMAACNIALEATIFNRNTYDNILEDDAIFEGMLTVALPLVLTAPATEIKFEGRDESPVRLPDIVRALEAKPEVWSEVTNLLVPPEWLQDTITQLVDVLFAVIDEDIDAVDQEVDLSVVRSRFNTGEVEEAARLIISEAPACTAEEESTMQEVISDNTGTLPICNPESARLRVQSIELVEKWFGFIAQDLGNDTVTVVQMMDGDRDGARQVYLMVDLYRSGLVLTYLCPLALLALIIILSVRALKGFGRWIGGISVAVGLLLLFLIITLQVASFGILSEALTIGTNPSEQFFVRLMLALLRAAVSASSSSLLIQSGIFVMLGFFLFAIAWYFGRNRDEESSVVIITDDGEVISTATQRRVGSLAVEDEKPKNG